MDRLDFEQDLKLIAEVAQHIFLPDELPPGAIIPQFDGYFKLEDVPLKTLLAKKLNPNEYLGGGNGLATTTQIIKQADVVLTLFLFNDRYPLETKSANWEFLRAPHRAWLQPERLLLFAHCRPDWQSGLGLPILHENGHD